MSYRNCKWCHGRGCLCCNDERKKDDARAVENFEKPIATFKTDDPADMELARQTIGAEALKKAFSEGGGGVEEIEHNCAVAGLLQAIRKHQEKSE